MEPATLIHIGTDRQLLLDDLMIAYSRGVARKLHPPTRQEPAILPENPWEKGDVGSGTISKSGDRYLMWYTCDDERIFSDPKIPWFRNTAYAESEDGITWSKPSLGLRDYEGSTDNNLVRIGPSWTGDHGLLSAFRDTSPDATDEQRFKAVVLAWKDPVEKKGLALHALWSPDGKDWTRYQDGPTIDDQPLDTHSIPFWDERRGEYVLYTRDTAGEGSFGGGARWVRRSTSKDFLNWGEWETITAGETPFEHLYTNSCVPYERSPETYLMFPSRFVPERRPDPDWFGSDGVSDIVFMSSRDGVNFDRSFMEAFVRPGPDKNNWHERGLYMERGIIQTSPTELSLYGKESIRTPSVRITRYTLRTDGFVSVNAGYGGGEFTTQPFTFDGSTLELNYSTSAVGTVKVEIQDEYGNAVPGFALDDCPEMFADEIEGPVAWNGGGDVIALAGKQVQLRFWLKDADVYAFKFND